MARYQELLDQLPRGSAYANEGYILPLRDEPQEFLFQDVAFPNQRYGVFVDDIFRGTVTADANGSVIVSTPLEVGPHRVQVENDFNAQRLSAYVTVRNYAVWYAAYAEVLEGASTFFGIDPAIDSVENALSLSTADSIHIEDVHGRLLNAPNNAGYITDSYRTVLQSLRQAFRYFPVTVEGVAQVVAAYTNSRAYVLPRALRPRWWLGFDYAPNGDLDQRTHTPTSVLPNLNTQSISAVGSVSATAVSATPTNPPRPQALTVRFPAAWDGGNITVTGTNVSGTVLSEVFTNTGPVVGGFRTRPGAESFGTVTSIANDTIGTTGTALIGLSADAFVSIVEIEGSPIREGQATAGATYLTLNNIGGTLSLSFGSQATGANDNRVEIPLSGRYTIPYRAFGDRLVGIAAPGGTYDLSDGSGERGADRLYFEGSDRGILQVVLGNTGSLATNSPANVVTDFNAAVAADPRYTGTPASVLTSTSLLAGSAVALTADTNPFVGDTTRGNIRLHLGCADAAREIFGIPRWVGDSAGSAVAGALTLTYAPGDTIGGVTAPFTARVGRGLLATGIGTVQAASGRFAEFAAASVDLRVGECIRIESTGTAGNPGLHEVVAVVSVGVWRIKHESPTGTFTNAGGQTYQFRSLGDLVSVVAATPASNQVTLAAPGLPRDLPAGFQIELAGEMPFQTDPDHQEAPSSVVVDVDTTLAPTVSVGANINDDIAPAGQLTPDSWLVADGTAVAFKPRGLVSESGLAAERLVANIAFQASVPDIVPDLIAFPLTIAFWVQQHNAASQNFRVDVDFGTGFDTGNPVAVAGTLEFDGGRVSGTRYSRVDRQVIPPIDATQMVVRLVHEGSAAGQRIAVERGIVTADLQSALFLGQGTVLRSAQLTNFGELIYVWSPEDLNAAENAAIGIPATGSRPTDTNNKIDEIGPTHATLERFDVSEYDSTGAPVNVRGAYTDADWFAATRTNLDVVIGVPGRLSYLRPSRVSQVVAEVLAPDAFGVATLTDTTTHVAPFPQNPNGTTRLYEDGVPVPDTANASGVVPYVFTAGSVIDIDNGVYNSAAEYTLDYDVLMQVETAIIDLGSTSTEYIWFVDAHVLRTLDQTVGERELTSSLTFDADFTATLSTPSDQDKNSTVLIADNGVTQTVVADIDFDYTDQSTLTINPSVFNANSLYTLTYTSIFSSFVRSPDFTIEVRGSTSQALIPTTAYSVVNIDDPINNQLQFWQLRLSLSGVENTQDVQVHGLGLRGLRAFGLTPNAPGLVLP